MASIGSFFIGAQRLLDKTRMIDFIAPLLMRIYLAAAMLPAGLNKWNSFDSTANWFKGMGVPFPHLSTFLAAGSEIIGAVFLLIGFAVRWISIPLMITMLVAALLVHAPNGWFATASVESCLFNCSELVEANERKQAAMAILEKHGKIDWLTEKGSFVVLNNGMEFAATYFIMLLMLFFYGPGRASIDHLIARRFRYKPDRD